MSFKSHLLLDKLFNLQRQHHTDSTLMSRLMRWSVRSIANMLGAPPRTKGTRRGRLRSHDNPRPSAQQPETRQYLWHLQGEWNLHETAVAGFERMQVNLQRIQQRRLGPNVVDTLQRTPSDLRTRWCAFVAPPEHAPSVTQRNAL